MKKGLKLKLFGRVQGVGFRYFTQNFASKLGLKGFVKNMPDGSVLIKAYGDENKLNRFVSKIKEGPRTAEVNNLKKKEISLDKNYNKFSIKY
jgi:acylphosphatase